MQTFIRIAGAKIRQHALGRLDVAQAGEGLVKQQPHVLRRATATGPVQGGQAHPARGLEALVVQRLSNRGDVDVHSRIFASPPARQMLSSRSSCASSSAKTGWISSVWSTWASSPVAIIA